MFGDDGSALGIAVGLNSVICRLHPDKALFQETTAVCSSWTRTSTVGAFHASVGCFFEARTFEEQSDCCLHLDAAGRTDKSPESTWHTTCIALCVCARSTVAVR